MGPIRAGPMAPQGAKQRLLLAALLLHAPRAVGTTLLIETLWPGEQPDDPAAALRTQLSRLRTLLKRAGAPAALRSHPHGYALDVAPDAIDAVQFEHTLRRARASTSAAEQLALLDGALELWSGEAYEDVADAHLFAGEVARLNELRVGGWEQRIECLLALGRAEQAVAAAEQLVARERLRERPRALLMQALYAAGRQPEALNAFQEFRRLLSTELGLDPSPALRALEMQLLRHEVAAPAVRVNTSTVSDGRCPPRPLTRLIGREDELSHIERLLGTMRLITLVGPGGSGKTRLALELPRLIDPQRRLVWIPLDGLPRDADPLHHVAAKLDVRDAPERTLLDSIISALHDADALLIFDNCEHVIEQCAALIETLLRACPALAVIATSREPLRVPGEVTLPVPPLEVPDPDRGEIVTLTRCASVQLFVERAAAVRPGFELDDDNASVVARICRTLEGIPLAIEFAAARVRTLSLAEIAGRLDDHLALLTTGSRTAPPRHRTLRAVIEWSHDLLSPAERTALAQLSVFAGGVTLPAAEEVVAAADARVLDLITGLVEKSLVVADAATSRFRLLDSVRAYAHEQLDGSGEAEAVRRRHAEYFASLAEAAEPHLLGAERHLWIARLAAEQDNLRAALDWTLSDEHTMNARLASALWWFAHSRGRIAEARDWIERALRLMNDDVDAALRARVLYGAAMAAWIGGDLPAAALHAAVALECARTAGRALPLVHALCVSAWIARDADDHASATRFADESADVAQRGAIAAAELAFAVWNRGSIHYTAGNLDIARAAQEQALDVWRREGVSWGMSQVLHGLAIIALDEDRLDDAERLCRDAITALREDTDVYWICRVLEGLGAVLARRGDTGRAARLLGAADGLRAPIGVPLLAFEAPRHRQTVELLRRRMSSAEFEAEHERGRGMTLDEALAHALDVVPARPGA